MSDPAPKPTRRLPRFSLITLLIAVNVAGVLVWANVIEQDRGIPEGLDWEPPELHLFGITLDADGGHYGWPLTYLDSEEVDASFSDGGPDGGPYYSILAINLLLPVLLTALLAEFLVRRFRKAKPHDA